MAKGVRSAADCAKALGEPGIPLDSGSDKAYNRHQALKVEIARGT